MSEKFTREEMMEDAKWAIIDFLADGYEGYLCDAHNDIFNMDYYEANVEEAERKLNELGGYSVVNEVLTYEKENFGNTSDLYGSPVWVLTMVWYITGEEAMVELMEGVDLADDYWNEEMTEEDSMELSKIFKAKMLEE